MRCSDTIGGGPDAFVAEVDFSLAAMMRDVNVHGEQDFAARKMAVWRIVRGTELRVVEIRDYIGAVCEGIA